MTTETKKPAKWVDEVTMIPMGTEIEPFPMTPALLFTLLRVSADAIALHNFADRNQMQALDQLTQEFTDRMAEMSDQIKDSILLAAIASTTVDIFSGDEPQIITPDSTFKH